MLSLAHIEEILRSCCEIAESGLNSGQKAHLPKLDIDILEPPCDFLGANENPVIFVNVHTYKLLGKAHKNWIANKTIACKASFLKSKAIEIIGGIVHETGHAFNVAAGIKNSEANAYIFEIEAMLKLLKMGALQQFGCTGVDLRTYFKSRLSYFHIDTRDNPYLAGLVKSIEVHCGFEQKSLLLAQGSRFSFFNWNPPKEYEIVWSQRNIAYSN